MPPKGTPRIEALKVRNYRALKELELEGLMPFSVLLGPNGSGKSTVFDIFAFLSECFSVGLRKAWDKRGRFKELRSRGCDGPIVFELKYREAPHEPVITYHLAIDEKDSGPVVSEEFLQWKRSPSAGRPFKFLDFKDGSGKVILGEKPAEKDARVGETLASAEMLAVNSLGQFAKHPRVSALRRFITGWHLSYLTADNTRGVPEAGPQERLSQTGDNLPNVVQYLQERHPERLKKIFAMLSARIPKLEKVSADIMADGRLLLRIKDAPFDLPVLAKYASDGTLKMLAYLTLLYDPTPPTFIGIEEPENHLHPKLLQILAEECREASGQTQLMVTTHSPFFVNGVKADELWALSRDERGYTCVRRADAMRGIPEFMENGALLGQLWTEGHFDMDAPKSGDAH